MSKAKVEGGRVSVPGSSETIGYIIERHTDLDKVDTELVAIQLAQHMRNITSFLQDSAAFAERVKVDEKKAAELDELVLHVEARRRGETAATSRMDRISSYDPKALRREANIHRERVVEFTAKSLTYKEKSDQEDRNAKEAQALLLKAGARKRQRKAEKEQAIAAVLEGSRRREN